MKTCNRCGQLTHQEGMCNWCEWGIWCDKAHERQKLAIWRLAVIYAVSMLLLFIFLSLTGCAAPGPTRPLVETKTVEVPVRVPVAVSPSLTDAPAEPQLPPERLTNEDMQQYIKALRGYSCGLRAKLADIAIQHGSGAEPVECATFDDDGG